MNDELHEKIRRAQIAAGERVVLDHLESLGIRKKTTSVPEADDRREALLRDLRGRDMVAHEVSFLLDELDKARERARAAEARSRWQDRLLQWCRPRLRLDCYRDALDRYIAAGPIEPDGLKVVLSEPPHD